MALELTLPARFRAHLASHPGLLPGGSRVLVAYSGGADSTALLILLHRAARELDLRLEAAHFDHRLRRDSGSDAREAAARAAAAGVRCRIGRPRRPLAGDQASLRRARYAWLTEQVREYGADRLAIAHHADDQAETVLFRLLRGTGVPGLSGIPARRGVIARPLLPFRRRALEGWLRAEGVRWTEDPGNHDRRWARARIRHEILPELAAGSLDPVDGLLRAARSAAKARDLGRRLGAHLVRHAARTPTLPGTIALDRSALRQVGPEGVALALRVLASLFDVPLSAGGTRAGVEFISEGRSGGHATIGGGLRVAREFDRVIVSAAFGGLPETGDLQVHERAGCGSVRIGGRRWHVRWRPLEGDEARPDCIAVAVPEGHYPLSLRGWRAGDRIRLAGGSRKLKKLFGDRRVPVSQRAHLPLLADGRGNVLWVRGLAAAPPPTGARDAYTTLELDLTHE